MSTPGPTETLTILLILALAAAVVIAGLFGLIRLAAGRKPPPRPADLPSRARALKAAGQVERAILLVRGETGMTHEDAAHFVHEL